MTQHSPASNEPTPTMRFRLRTLLILAAGAAAFVAMAILTTYAEEFIAWIKA